MRKLTNEELRTPNVEYLVPDGTPLPDEIRVILKHYIGEPLYNTRTKRFYTRYSIPAYLAHDWLTRYR
jgi:hypothetical protein